MSLYVLMTEDRTIVSGPTPYIGKSREEIAADMGLEAVTIGPLSGVDELIESKVKLYELTEALGDEERVDLDEIRDNIIEFEDEPTEIEIE